MKTIFAKQNLLLTAVAAAGLSAGMAQATEFGRVISSTPVVEQISVPRQVCTTSQVQSQARTGGGALIGAVVGGALGNQFGHGTGRAVSTMIGAVGGGVLGDHIEAQNYGTYPVTQNVQQCHTVNAVENRTVGYNVLYEYAGQRYTVQMPQQPGSRIALQVSTVGHNYYPQPMGVQVMAQPVLQPVQPIYYAPPVQTVTYVRPAPVVVAAPVRHARPYYDGHANRWEQRERNWR